MAAFKVNGKNVCSEKNQKLLRFLRDELRLTSVKDGCSEGACGACTVIIDGKTCKACVPDTDSLLFYKLDNQDSVRQISFYYRKNRYCPKAMEVFLEMIDCG